MCDDESQIGIQHQQIGPVPKLRSRYRVLNPLFWFSRLFEFEHELVLPSLYQSVSTTQVKQTLPLNNLKKCKRRPESPQRASLVISPPTFIDLVFQWRATPIRRSSFLLRGQKLGPAMQSEQKSCLPKSWCWLETLATCRTFSSLWMLVCLCKNKQAPLSSGQDGDHQALIWARRLAVWTPIEEKGRWVGKDFFAIFIAGSFQRWTAHVGSCWRVQPRNGTGTQWAASEHWYPLQYVGSPW